MKKKYVVCGLIMSFCFFSLEELKAVSLERSVTTQIDHNVNGGYDAISDSLNAFRNGIRFVPQTGISPSFNSSKHSFDYSVIGNGLIQFMTKSFVPTIKNITTNTDYGSGVIMKTEPENFSVKLLVKDVKADGTPASSSTTLTRVTNDVKFEPLVNLYLTDQKPETTDLSVPGPSDPIQFSFGALQKIYTYFTTESNLRDLPSNTQGFVKAHLSANALTNKVELTNDDLASDYGSTDVVNSTTFYGSDFAKTYINLKEEGFAEDLSLAFSSKLNYQVNDFGNTRTVTTAGGNLGYKVEGTNLFLEDITSAVASHTAEVESIVIGADIEGQVLTEGTNYSLRDKTDFDVTGKSRLLQIGGVNSVDVREDITRKAFELVRGLTLETSNTLNGIDFTNKKILYFKGNTVELSGNINGVGTIVIEDGNLFIKGNLKYASSTDSLGVILINSKSEEKPALGNIFVKESVKNMVGTYFADGSFTSTDKTTNPLISDDIDRSSQTIFGNQLLLEGTLFTRNTLGGAFLSTGTYLSPWGTETDRIEAQKYDLHFIRRYAPPKSGGSALTTISENGNCVPQDATTCDGNNHAFIIRPDGKVKNISPPGFTSL